MPGQFNYERRRKYPHLLGQDYIIWDRFILLYPDRFDTVDYDVHIGSGIMPPEDQPTSDDIQWQALTQKRIDVIGWKDNLPTIVEVKYRVSLETLGQLLGYQVLYSEQFPEYQNVPLLCVCAFIAGDDLQLFQHFNIPWVIV